MRVAVIRRGDDIKKALTVEYKSRDGTAKAGEDYQECNGQLSFGPNEIRQEITVKIIEDNAFEADEIFFIDLLNPKSSGGEVKLGENSTVEIAILDDDDPGMLVFEKEEIEVEEGEEDRKWGGQGRRSAERGGGAGREGGEGEGGAV